MGVYCCNLLLVVTLDLVCGRIVVGCGVCVYCDFVNGLFACGFDTSVFAYCRLVVGG